MVRLKRNSKGEVTEVKPIRTRKGSVYVRGSNTVFKISRSKFSNFLECKRCFYLERVKGLKDPSMPGWSLNSAVDDLLKKEFDEFRKKQKPHAFVQKSKFKLILIGCITIVLLQMFVHVGVNIRLLPTTGMTLPFLSYGGSSIISTAVISGLILNFTKRKLN